METCVGCGSPVETNWKFCIHCGLAIDRSGAANGPAAASALAGPTTAPQARLSSRSLIIGGIAIVVIALGLIALAIAFFAGAFR